MKFTITKVVTYNLQVRPDAPADGGEGFKRTWSEAKEEVGAILISSKTSMLVRWSMKVISFCNQQAGWAEDGQGNGKRAGVSCVQQ